MEMISIKMAVPYRSCNACGAIGDVYEITFGYSNHFSDVALCGFCFNDLIDRMNELPHEEKLSTEKRGRLSDFPKQCVHCKRLMTYASRQGGSIYSCRQYKLKDPTEMCPFRLE